MCQSSQWGSFNGRGGQGWGGVKGVLGFDNFTQPLGEMGEGARRLRGYPQKKCDNVGGGGGGGGGGGAIPENIKEESDH